mmetsp:Transcript_23177/g.17602  ORF Transcript_23177/g.17602 Transcript_23177/m.17602 type:complete len:230 (-) Transcript_23177:268-957(-)
MRLQQHILQQIVQVDVVLSDFVDVLVAVYAALEASAGVGVVVGLKEEPILIVQLADVVDAVCCLRNNNAFVGAGAGEDPVDGNDGGGGGEVVHHAREGVAGKHHFSSSYTDLRQAFEDVAHYPEVLLYLGTTSSSTRVQGHRVSMSAHGGVDSLVPSKHDGFEEELASLVELSDIACVSDRISKGKVHVPSMDDLSIWHSGHDRSAERLVKFERVVEEEDQGGVQFYDL